jgi:hypothetical protein
VRRLVEAIKRWLAGILRRPAPDHDAKRELDDFFGS